MNEDTNLRQALVVHRCQQPRHHCMLSVSPTLMTTATTSASITTNIIHLYTHLTTHSYSMLSPVSTGMGDHLRANIPSRYVTSQLGPPCIPSRLLNRVLALTGYSKAGNVTSAKWQVMLCDPIWHVSSRSGEDDCKLLYPVECLLTLILYTTE